MWLCGVLGSRDDTMVAISKKAESSFTTAPLSNRQCFLPCIDVWVAALRLFVVMSRWASLMFDCEYASVGCTLQRVKGELSWEGCEEKRREECVWRGKGRRTASSTLNIYYGLIREGWALGVGCVAVGTNKKRRFQPYHSFKFKCPSSRSPVSSSWSPSPWPSGTFESMQPRKGVDIQGTHYVLDVFDCLIQFWHRKCVLRQR